MLNLFFYLILCLDIRNKFLIFFKILFLNKKYILENKLYCTYKNKKKMDASQLNKFDHHHPSLPKRTTSKNVHLAVEKLITSYIRFHVVPLCH